MIPGHAGQIWASLQIGELNIAGDPAFKVPPSGPLSSYGMILETRVSLSQCCVSTQPIPHLVGIPLSPSTRTFTQRTPDNRQISKRTKGLQHSPGKKAVIASRRRATCETE